MGKKFKIGILQSKESVNVDLNEDQISNWNFTK
jgi:hypothetical protein